MGREVAMEQESCAKPWRRPVGVTPTRRQGSGGQGALDKLDEPPSLLALRAAVDNLLPRVDLPDVLLGCARRGGLRRVRVRRCLVELWRAGRHTSAELAELRSVAPFHCLPRRRAGEPTPARTRERATARHLPKLTPIAK